MKKFLPYILILAVILQIFAPFTIGSGTKNNVEIQVSKAEAEYDYTESGITLRPESEVTKNSIKLIVNVIWGTSPSILLSRESILITLMSDNGEEIRSQEIDNLGPSGELNQSGSVTFNKLEPSTTYKVIIKASQRSQTVGEAINNWLTRLSGLEALGEWTNLDQLPLGVGDYLFKPDESTGTITNYDNPYLITTLQQNDNSTINEKLDVYKNEAALLPSCDIASSSTWGGCIGIVLYKLIFKPSAYIFAITGKLLDFTFWYTIQDPSYRSQFVVEGWGMVRDFCNMFFIFILLYIAFGTILNLSSVKTKEMIINVVIIGLLINFSLFATQVIIDASNILARVFYNQILIGEKDKNTDEIKEELGLGGSKQLTVALVNKINPQKILMNAEKGSNITGKGIIVSDPKTVTKGVDSGTFILVVILASIMNIVGLYVFFVVSLVFIARVIGLWLAMIVVPMAFFSYAVPQMQDTEMIGWKKWWPDTLKMAFLAPVFIVFLYLIITFLNSGMGILNADNKEGIDFFIATIVPFAFLMILLLKAKDITTKMSGKIGESLTGIAKSVGGFAVGAGLGLATGGAAMAMRGTVGKLGSQFANSKRLANMESKGGPFGWMAKQARNAGTGVSKSSFDVRATKLGAMAGTKLGVDIGKAKEGGFAKHQTDQIEKKKKRAQELKEINTKSEKNAVLDAQYKLDEIKTNQTLQDTIKAATTGVTDAEKALAISEKDLKDTIDRYGGNSWQADIARDERNDRFNDVNTAKDGLKSAEKPIKDAETNLQKAQNALANTGRDILKEYSKSIQDSDANLLESIFSFGQSTLAANQQAAREILANLPQEKK